MIPGPRDSSSILTISRNAATARWTAPTVKMSSAAPCHLAPLVLEQLDIDPRYAAQFGVERRGWPRSSTLIYDNSAAPFHDAQTRAP